MADQAVSGVPRSSCALIKTTNVLKAMNKAPTVGRGKLQREPGRQRWGQSHGVFYRQDQARNCFDVDGPTQRHNLALVRWITLNQIIPADSMATPSLILSFRDIRVMRPTNTSRPETGDSTHECIRHKHRLRGCCRAHKWFGPARFFSRASTASDREP